MYLVTADIGKLWHELERGADKLPGAVWAAVYACRQWRERRLADISAIAWMYEREAFLPQAAGNGIGAATDLPMFVEQRARWLKEVAPSVNLIQGTVDTVVARLFTEAPAIEVQTANARHEERKMAELRSAALDSVMNASDSRAGAVLETVGRDGALKGFGAVRPHIARGQVRYERVHQYQLFWDPEDARDGDPECLHYWHRVSRSRLVSKLRATDTPAKVITAVRKMPRGQYHGPYDSTWTYGPYDADAGAYQIDQADLLNVVHSWKLPGGPEPKYDEERGRHVITVFGGRQDDPDHVGVVVYDEEWERQTFPIAMWAAHPRDEGIDGFGYGHVLWPWQAAVDRTMAKIQGTFDKLGHTKVLLPMTAEGDSAVNETDWLAKGIAPVYLPAQVFQMLTQSIVPSNPVSAQELQHLQWMIATSRSLQGINDGLSEGGTRLGANASAVALIEEDHRQLDRLAEIDKHFTEFKLAVARETLNAIDDAVEEDSSFKVKWQDSDGQWLEMRWSELASDNQRYDVGLEPVGALGQTRSGRLTKIREWAQQGIVDPQVAADAMLTSPDVRRLAADMTAPRRMVERQLDELMLAAVRKRAPEGNVWPDKNTPLETAKAIVERRIQRALAENASAEVIGRYQEYKGAVDEMVGKQQPPAGMQAPELTQAAALGEVNPAAAAGGVPMPAPGMPPGPMGM